ncbi:DUF2127 domain-containing protein [Rhodobacterales bacterium HKCCE3408]|nr:DUF2127 domain-containing protein [Rhodobacterales bacterium HKCCE3408]
MLDSTDRPEADDAAELTRFARIEHRVFILTLAGKASLGTVQLAIAAAIYLGFADRLPSIARRVFRAELAADPTDFLANHVMSLVRLVSSADLGFYTAYFLVHGLSHVAIAGALLAGAGWAYPAGIIALGAFVVYQVIEWWHVGGVTLIVLTLIDLAVIAMSWSEWQRKRARDA